MPQGISNLLLQFILKLLFFRYNVLKDLFEKRPSKEEDMELIFKLRENPSEEFYQNIVKRARERGLGVNIDSNVGLRRNSMDGCKGFGPI